MKETVRIIQLPKISDKRGNLSFFEDNNQIPFKIQRTFWIYDVPGGESRDGHAYKDTEEFIVALSGSFDVVIKEGKSEKVYSLNRSYFGLYIPRMTWRKFCNFSTNSLALVVTSSKYSKEDYIRNYKEYLKLLNNNHNE